jgi:YD repeat-containing protein
VVPPGTETGPAWVTIAGVNAPSQNFTINTSAQITDSLGRSSSYTSVMLGGTWLGSDAQGSGCSRCTVRGTIHNDYDSVGRLTATTDELLHVTNLAYDAVRELIFSHRPKPGVVTAGAGHVAEAPLPVPKGNGSLCHRGTRQSGMCRKCAFRHNSPSTVSHFCNPGDTFRASVFCCKLLI